MRTWSAASFTETDPKPLYLVDTNVFVRRIEVGSPYSLIAKSALQTLRNRGDEPVVVPQTLYELWVVLTRSTTARGGLWYSVADARRLISGVTAMCRVPADDPMIFSEWLRLVSFYKVSGLPAHDTRLVAAMKVHGVTHILTSNGMDFNRYSAEAVTVVHPANP